MPPRYGGLTWLKFLTILGGAPAISLLCILHITERYFKSFLGRKVINRENYFMAWKITEIKVKTEFS